jgi:ribonuclease BN (tRNA processing enzyme)
MASDQSLKLTNGGELDLFFIGVGSMFAMKNFQTNFLIVKGESHLLVDFGMTGPLALATTARLHPAMIEYFLPTHCHEDHVGGTSYLALMNRYVGIPFMKRPKIKMVITEEYRQILWERTLRGSLEWNETVTRTGRLTTLNDYYDFVTPVHNAGGKRETWTAQVGSIKVEMFRTRHVPEQAKTLSESFVSYGVCIDDRVFVSGDTQFDRELVEWYDERGAEAFFHDVQFFPGAVHAPLDDLKTLPEPLRRRMFLMHYADNWDRQDASAFAGWTRQGVIYKFD